MNNALALCEERSTVSAMFSLATMINQLQLHYQLIISKILYPRVRHKAPFWLEFLAMSAPSSPVSEISPVFLADGKMP